MDDAHRYVPVSDRERREMLESIGKPLDAVLLLRVSDTVAIERMHARAEVEGRTDDSPEVIENRVRLYNELTVPVVDHYRAAGIVRPVDGERPVEEVFEEIEAALSEAGART